MAGAILAYEHPIEHLSDELKRLDITLEMELLQMNAAPAAALPVNEIPGMFISASEAKSLLDDDHYITLYTPDQENRMNQLEHTIVARLNAAGQQGIDIPLEVLRRRFQLSDLQIRALVVAAAPHVSRQYSKVYGYLQDDTAGLQLTIDLMLRLSSKHAKERRALLQLLTRTSDFYRLFFNKQPATGSLQFSSILSSTISLHDRFIHYVLGLEWRYEGPLRHLTLHTSKENRDLTPVLVNQKLQEHITAYSSQRQEQAETTVWMLRGPSGSGKTYQARLTCGALGRALLEWDMSCAPEEEQAFIEAVDWMLLEATLQDAIPAFNHVHTLQSPSIQTTRQDRRQDWFMQRLAAWTGLIFLFSEEEFKPEWSSSAAITWLDIPLSIPDIGERLQLWQTLSYDSLPLSSEDASKLAGKFLFTPGKIASTIDEVRRLEDWRKAAADHKEKPPSASQLVHQAAYRLISHRLKDKAVKMEPRFTWEDLILPQETLQLLQQACSRVHHRHTVMHSWGFDRKLPYGRGISMLFTGPPGTGKTMSAVVMAREMEAELYRIDLSRVVSKYIGETEKNLGEIFDQARLSGAILFFDEADALFGKRSEVKDAHDKYANMETSYLLQKMEEYDGLTILATNFAQNLDDAFTRRIQYIVKYPFPDALQREQLWQATFPKELPVDHIDYKYLSEAFELSGGSIKNIVLTAAFLAAREAAPVSMKQLLEGVIQEYKKTGKVLLKDRLGAYADYWKG
jgi:hypothetical protein